MQAISNSTAVLSPQQSSTLLRIGDVSRRFNVATTTIRRATSNGSLLCLTLPSGHRRFREQDVLSWLGICHAEENGHDGQIPIAAVIRVSSDGQARRVGSSEKSSLEHQEQRVRSYINNRWGEKAKITWYKSVGSGMNFERKVFLQLIKDILDDKYRNGFIVATDPTRLARFAVQLISFLVNRGGAQLIFTMNDEDKDLNETLTDEILSILTHYTAKASEVDPMRWAQKGVV
ncbi:MAG: hypothetical protein CMJ50_10585 [Planctomycetaceae bacterium]|jgi:predicted site-specific integrase-resolvase|nr:hypothetical protein [Planctomycetaceae bacterium]